MSTKQIPGPWTLSPTGLCVYAGSSMIELTGPDSHEQRHASARLIAAAPDLLDALGHCVAELESLGLAGEDAPYNLPAALAAIDKAKGLPGRRHPAHRLLQECNEAIDKAKGLT